MLILQLFPEKIPVSLTDRTLNIEFRHTLGYLNYFILLENFIYLYCRDTRTGSMFKNIDIDIFNERGEVYSKIVLMDPIINGMDMLDFDYTQPIAQSGTFKIEIKYSNFDYEFKTESLHLPEDYEISHITKLPEDVYL